MKAEDVQKNLNKMVVYKGKADIYRLTAGIIRKKGNKSYYTLELLDTKHGNSVIICKLADVDVSE